jgi:hypothetical protein
VHEPVLVREGKPARNLEAELDHLVHRQRPFALDELLQVLAVDVLEDDELAPVLLAAVDDRDDVRVRQLRDRPRLAAKALDVVLVPRVLLVQDLERDRALEQPVVRAEDVGHAAGADQFLQLVAAHDELTDHA